MREDKKQALLNYLNHNKDWTTTNELASFLGVSSRQVRNYISDINSSNNIIKSSQYGYKINDNFNEYINNDFDSEINNRRNYAVQKLISHIDGYSIYDLANELYVSESTINSDINYIKKDIKSYNIQIKRNGEYFYLIGEERNFRRLMRNIIQNNLTNEGFFQNEKALFDLKFNNTELENLLDEIFKCEKIKINGFALKNITVHLIIMLDRIKDGYQLKESDLDIETIDNHYIHVSRLISDAVYGKYNISFNIYEIKYLSFLISTNTMQSNIENFDVISLSTIREYVKDEYINISNNLIHMVEENYYLPPFKEKFLVYFMLHIQNLFYRVKYKHFVSNPLTEKIKLQYPLVYDISVFIANELKEKYNAVLNEDEVAFISFHFGAYFENNSLLKNTQVTCAFVYADYYDFYKNTIDNIQSKFSEKLKITTIIPFNEFNKLSNLESDLYIVSAPLVEKTNHNVIYINLFPKDEDYEKIENAIYKISKNKEAQELKDYTFNFFNEDFFYPNIEINDCKQLLQFMTDDLYKNGYTNSKFYNDILVREKASSTAFHSIAVPHALTSDNIHKCFISIATFKDGIKWFDSQNVNIVAIIGVNKNSRYIFSMFFEKIVNIFDNYPNVLKIISAKSYNEFIKILLELYDSVKEY